MTVLSDRTLRSMYPDNPHISGASIDVHLGDTLLVWPSWITRDPRIDQRHHWRPVDLVEITPDDHGWIIEPGQRYLGATRERLAVPAYLAAEVTGRSSWGRDGLAVHQTAGWIDPLFRGTVTLELSVIGSKLVLRPGDRVAQLVFHELDLPCLNGYSGKYLDQTGPTPSRSHEDAA